MCGRRQREEEVKDGEKYRRCEVTSASLVFVGCLDSGLERAGVSLAPAPRKVNRRGRFVVRGRGQARPQEDNTQQ